MLNAISPYGSYAAYGAAYASRAALTQGPDKAQTAQRTAPQLGPAKGRPARKPRPARLSGPPGAGRR